jgi:hypothetical protein
MEKYEGRGKTVMEWIMQLFSLIRKGKTKIQNFETLQ